MQGKVDVIGDAPCCTANSCRCIRCAGVRQGAQKCSLQLPAPSPFARPLLSLSPHPTCCSPQRLAKYGVVSPCLPLFALTTFCSAPSPGDQLLVSLARATLQPLLVRGTAVTYSILCPHWGGGGPQGDPRRVQKYQEARTCILQVDGEKIVTKDILQHRSCRYTLRY